MFFSDRHDAGRQLADRLAAQELVEPVVLALPRGGVPVAYEVAHRLEAPLDVLVARKIGAPWRPELGVGAIAEGGEPVFDPTILDAVGLRADDLADTVARERVELERRVRRYRGDRALPAVRGRDTVVIDDGLATGVTARAALRALRGLHPRRLILAVPVCASQTVALLREEADDALCLHAPAEFMGVGQWYRDFSQTSDDTVVELLARAGAEPTA